MGFRLSPTDTVTTFVSKMDNKTIAAPTKKALTNAFKGVSPSLFFGEDTWSGTTRAQYKIKLSEANFNIIVKNIKIPLSQIKPAAGKKTTTFTLNGYTIGLETSRKYLARKADWFSRIG